MKLIWNKQDDALYFRLDESEIYESEEIQPGVLIDFDKSNRIVGFEIINVSERVLPEKLKVLQYETI